MVISLPELRAKIEILKSDISWHEDEIGECEDEIARLERAITVANHISNLSTPILKQLQNMADTMCTWREAGLVKAFLNGDGMDSEDLGRVKLLARTLLGITL